MTKLLISLMSFGLLLLAVTKLGYTQQTDTTEVTKHLQQEETFLQPHNERKVGNMFMPKTGQFNVPEPKQYYTPPFKGQKYLEIALEAYYKKWEGGKSLLYQFINTVAPFIDNQFEFAVYQIYDLPIVERDQPMLDPQLPERQEN